MKTDLEKYYEEKEKYFISVEFEIFLASYKSDQFNEMTNDDRMKHVFESGWRTSRDYEYNGFGDILRKKKKARTTE